VTHVPVTDSEGPGGRPGGYRDVTAIEAVPVPVSVTVLQVATVAVPVTVRCGTQAAGPGVGPGPGTRAAGVSVGRCNRMITDRVKS
jgi:hypothetical protein